MPPWRPRQRQANQMPETGKRCCLSSFDILHSGIWLARLSNVECHFRMRVCVVASLASASVPNETERDQMWWTRSRCANSLSNYPAEIFSAGTRNRRSRPSQPFRLCLKGLRMSAFAPFQSGRSGRHPLRPDFYPVYFGRLAVSLDARHIDITGRTQLNIAFGWNLCNEMNCELAWVVRWGLWTT